MAHKLTPLLLLAVLSTTLGVARGQEAVSSITQARLFTNSSAPGTSPVDANGNTLPESDAASSGDDSFGAQVILKNQERRRTFSVFTDVSVFYTNNVDLTPHGTRSDSFLAANIGAAWRPTVTWGLVAEISAVGSVFRFDRASELDFERLSVGAGLSWLVPRTPGIIAFTRYDFTELLDSQSNELLQEHVITIGAQKIFAFGRSHFLMTGITGMLGISTPRSQERDQAGIHAAYHLQITRSVDADLLYRYAAQVYEEGDRLDHNQTFSLAVGLAPTRWLRVEALVSAARNDSNQTAFDYDVFNLGGGVRVNVSF